MSVRTALLIAVGTRTSQQRLAKDCGVSQAAISKAIKNGRCGPRLALKIEAATGIDRRRLCPDVFDVAPPTRTIASLETEVHA